MEKAYLDGNGQYWYNISGKQSLDTYCSIQNVGIDVIKKLLLVFVVKWKYWNGI